MEVKEIRWKYDIWDKEQIHEIYKEIDINGREQYLNNSLLHIACNYADYEAVKILIDRGIDVNIENENQDRPLHSLIKREDGYNNIEDIVNCTKILVENRASVMRKNVDGQTPVILAAQHGEYDILKVFLDNNLKLTMKDSDGNTALHIACKYIHSKKEENYLKIIKLLLNNGFDVEDKNIEGKTALNIANDKNNEKLIAILKGDNENSKSLYEAMQTADYPSIEENLKMIDINSTLDEKGEFYGMTLLGMACYKLDDKMVELLLNNGADPNFKNSQGINSVGEMLGYNKDSYFDNQKLHENIVPKIFEMLINKGLNIDDTVDNEGNTALIKASKSIDINSSYNGNTLSSIIAKQLLKNNCDIDKVNLEGQSALMLLSNSRRTEAVNLQIELLEMGANISLVDKNGDTALIYAAKNRDDSVAYQMAEMLLEFGDAKVEHVNNDGKTALDIATENDNEELVKLLLMNM